MGFNAQKKSCSQDCSGLNDCELQDLKNVDTSGLNDGDLLCWHALSETFVNISKDNVLRNIEVTLGGSYDPATMILTLTDVNGVNPDTSVNLATLRSSFTDNGNGTFTHNDGNGTMTIVSVVSNGVTNLIESGFDGGSFLSSDSVASVFRDTSGAPLTPNTQVVTASDLTDVSAIRAEISGENLVFGVTEGGSEVVDTLIIPDAPICSTVEKTVAIVGGNLVKVPSDHQTRQADYDIVTTPDISIAGGNIVPAIGSNVATIQKQVVNNHPCKPLRATFHVSGVTRIRFGSGTSNDLSLSINNLSTPNSGSWSMPDGLPISRLSAVNLTEEREDYKAFSFTYVTEPILPGHVINVGLGLNLQAPNAAIPYEISPVNLVEVSSLNLLTGVGVYEEIL